LGSTFYIDSSNTDILDVNTPGGSFFTLYINNLNVEAESFKIFTIKLMMELSAVRYVPCANSIFLNGDNNNSIVPVYLNGIPQGYYGQYFIVTITIIYTNGIWKILGRIDPFYIQ